MSRSIAEEVVQGLRKFGSEATAVEAKRAEGGLPKSVKETLSSFSNTPGGGTILLGIDEGAGFKAIGLSDPAKLLADLGSACRDDISPPLQPELSVDEVDGKRVVVAVIFELPKRQKPAYVRSLGLERGSYLRVGDGDRRLTSEEVHQLVADRGQPLFDHEPILDAAVEDLEPRAVHAYLLRVRSANARIFGNEPESVILRMTRVVVKGHDGRDYPTIAGLLALGRYPQQFLPQLNVTFVHYPTVQGEATASGVRFLDNVSINGPIPVMAAEVLAVIRRNMSRRALIVGEGRRDVWEYPPEALREAVVNALVHRDLSPGSRGIQVQIECIPIAYE